MTVDKTSETRSLTPGSGQHVVKELVTAFIEILAYYTDPLFTDPLGLPLIDPPSTRYVDSYSSYQLPLDSTTTQSFGMNPSSFGFPEVLGNLSLSKTHVVVIFGASFLLKTLVTQANPTQPLVHSSPFTHGSGNILASIFPHIHTPSALLSHSFSQMVGSQVIHTTTVAQDTHPPYHTSHISTPYIGSQYSMGG
jgi:hypothetical protein